MAHKGNSCIARPPPCTAGASLHSSLALTVQPSSNLTAEGDLTIKGDPRKVEFMCKDFVNVRSPSTLPSHRNSRNAPHQLLHGTSRTPLRAAAFQTYCWRGFAFQTLPLARVLDRGCCVIFALLCHVPVLLRTLTCTPFVVCQYPVVCDQDVDPQLGFNPSCNNTFAIQALARCLPPSSFPSSPPPESEHRKHLKNDSSVPQSGKLSVILLNPKLCVSLPIEFMPSRIRLAGTDALIQR